MTRASRPHMQVRSGTRSAGSLGEALAARANRYGWSPDRDGPSSPKLGSIDSQNWKIGLIIILTHFIIFQTLNSHSASVVSRLEKYRYFERHVRILLHLPIDKCSTLLALSVLALRFQHPSWSEVLRANRHVCDIFLIKLVREAASKT